MVEYADDDDDESLVSSGVGGGHARPRQCGRCLQDMFHGFVSLLVPRERRLGLNSDDEDPDGDSQPDVIVSYPRPHDVPAPRSARRHHRFPAAGVPAHGSSSSGDLDDDPPNPYSDALDLRDVRIPLGRRRNGRRRPSCGSLEDVDGPTSRLLPPRDESFDYVPEHGGRPRKVLVLDLDETLVHSSLDQHSSADYVIPVSINGSSARNVYVRKRPHVDAFLAECGRMFEVVVFTASLRQYAGPLLDRLDPARSIFTSRLFREHCTFLRGAYRKDLARLGRTLSQTLIVDNSPIAFDMQPENGLLVSSWFDQNDDQELMDVLPWLRRIAADDEVYDLLCEFRVYNSGRFEQLPVEPQLVGDILTQVAPENKGM